MGSAEPGQKIGESFERRGNVTVGPLPKGENEVVDARWSPVLRRRRVVDKVDYFFA